VAALIATSAALAHQPRQAPDGRVAGLSATGRPRLHSVPPVHAGHAALDPLCQRALLLWPGLDRVRLGRTRGDPNRIARLIARRTIHSEETILALLQRA
jgi:hypothetical protein